MDRKSIIVLVASFGLLLLWQMLIPRFFPPVRLPQTNTLARAPNRVATNGVPAPIVPTTNPPAPTLAVPPPVIAIATNAPEETQVLETAEAIYTFTSHGGGL